jgi:hypothetical protein
MEPGQRPVPQINPIAIRASGGALTAHMANGTAASKGVLPPEEIARIEAEEELRHSIRSKRRFRTVALWLLFLVGLPALFLVWSVGSEIAQRPRLGTTRTVTISAAPCTSRLDDITELARIGKESPGAYARRSIELLGEGQATVLKQGEEVRIVADLGEAMEVSPLATNHGAIQTCMIQTAALHE